MNNLKLHLNERDADWQLREADDRHRSILNALGAIVVRCDGNGLVLSVNDVGHTTQLCAFLS